MTATTDTGPAVDRYGIRHKPKCDQPGWRPDPPAVPGIRVMRCTGCGVVRLTRKSK